jgi:hypothetical protein
MAKNVDFDLRKFKRFLETSKKVIANGAKRGMHDALDEWEIKAVDLAPLDKSTLRRGINTEIVGMGLNIVGEISSVAIEQSERRGRFNYAYYIHEVKGEINNPTTPGTIAKYIDKPLEDNDERWLAMIEREIERELRRRGMS